MKTSLLFSMLFLSSSMIFGQETVKYEERKLDLPEVSVTPARLAIYDREVIRCFCGSYNCEYYIQEIVPTQAQVEPEKTFKMYPNPSASTSTIEIENIESDLELMVVDLSGKIITERKIAASERRFQLDVSSYSNGAYFLKLYTENQAWTKQLIVVH